MTTKYKELARFTANIKKQAGFMDQKRIKYDIKKGFGDERNLWNLIDNTIKREMPTVHAFNQLDKQLKNNPNEDAEYKFSVKVDVTLKYNQKQNMFYVYTQGTV